MARIKIVNKNPDSTYTMSIKENKHIRRSKKYKVIIAGLSLVCLVELIILGAKCGYY